MPCAAYIHQSTNPPKTIPNLILLFAVLKEEVMVEEKYERCRGRKVWKFGSRVREGGGGRLKKERMERGTEAHVPGLPSRDMWNAIRTYVKECWSA